MHELQRLETATNRRTSSKNGGGSCTHKGLRRCRGRTAELADAPRHQDIRLYTCYMSLMPQSTPEPMEVALELTEFLGVEVVVLNYDVVVLPLKASHSKLGTIRFHCNFPSSGALHPNIFVD